VSINATRETRIDDAADAIHRARLRESRSLEVPLDHLAPTRLDPERVRFVNCD
jgi:hypothetical protein